MVKEKWTIIQPVCRGGSMETSGQWSNHTFLNFSRLFNAKLYHITDSNIEMDSDVYHIVNFDIGLLEQEIEFAKAVKRRGAKVTVGFSQDFRFLIGDGLISNQGHLYTELCKVADGIQSGVPDKGIYGRFQDKVILMGEILEDQSFALPYENRSIDLVTSGPAGEQSLSFELEFLLMIKEKYPDKKLVSCIHAPHRPIVEKLRVNYPQITFAIEHPLMDYMRMSKVYCNPEIRPRPGRTLMEAFYFRVPFISSSWTYYSKLCKEFSYNKVSITEMFDKYELLIHSDVNEIIYKMEQRAQEEMFDAVYSRIKEKLGI